MDRSMLAILAYTIARYEKGRIPMRPTLRYMKWKMSLRKSLDHLELLVDMLDDQVPVTRRAINDVVNYVEHNGMIQFNSLQRSQFCTSVARDCYDTQCETDEDRQVIELMRRITTTCCDMISKHSFRQKIYIFYLLQAFHTLARGCIKSADTEIIRANMYALSPKEAIDEAKATLNAVKSIPLLIKT